MEYKDIIESYRYDEIEKDQLIHRCQLLSQQTMSKDSTIKELSKEMRESSITNSRELSILSSKVSSVLTFVAKARYQKDIAIEENQRLKLQIKDLERNMGVNSEIMTPRPDWHRICKEYEIEEFDPDMRTSLLVERLLSSHFKIPGSKKKSQKSFSRRQSKLSQQFN